MSLGIVLKPRLLATLCEQLAIARRNGPHLLQVAQILADDEDWPAIVKLRMQQPVAAASTAVFLCDIPCELLPFPAVTVQLMVAAEREGVLIDTLSALSDEFIAQDDTRRAVRAAVFWPSTAMIVLVMMLSGSAVILLPAFQKFYADAGVEAPLSTQVLSALVEWTVHLWWFWIPVVAIIAVTSLSRRWPRSIRSRSAAVCYELPFVRRYLTDRYLVRMARWLGVIAAGSPIKGEVLNYLHETQLVPKLQRSTRYAEQALSTGASYSTAMSSPSLPRRLSLFLKIGETTHDVPGTLRMFLAMALAAEQESLARFERGVLLVSYLVVGTLVGVFVSGIYGSISSLGSSL